MVTERTMTMKDQVTSDNANGVGEATSEAPLPPVTGSEDSCDCWNEKDNKLREMGYKIADACSMLQIKDLDLTAKYGLPLQRTDGKKLSRSNAKMIIISFCPFCGKALDPQNAGTQRSGGQ